MIIKDSTFLSRHGAVSRALVGALLAGGSLALFNTQASADTHVTVRQGDTLSNLATAYDSTVDQIVQKNNISADTPLKLGQQLDIPNSRPDEWVGTDRSTADFNNLAKAGFNTNIWADSDSSDSQAPVSSTNGQGSQFGNNVDNTTATDQNGNPVSTNAQANTYAYNGGSANSDNSYTYSAYNSDNNANSYVAAAQSVTPSQSTGYGAAQYAPQDAVNRAASQIGVPYVWGGTTPGQGFDCSGLVQWAYGLPAGDRTTYQQQSLGAHHYDVENAQSGDIYFWGSDAAPYHEAMATGNGNYIQAPQPGQNVQKGNINWYRPSYYVSMQQN